MSDHPNSRAAFLSMLPHLTDLNRAIVECLLHERATIGGGLTCDEIEQIINRSHQSTSAALRALKKRGIVVETDRKRPTRSGRNAQVVALGRADKGHPALETPANPPTHQPDLFEKGPDYV